MTLDKIYNEDCYEGIKKIPDKSVDLVYIDIPYLIGNGGLGKSDLSLRIVKEHYELGNETSKKNMQKKLDEFKEKMTNAKDKYEYEKYHCLHSNLLNKMNLDRADIVKGIDYKIFDELCRVMKHIYIYMV